MNYWQVGSGAGDRDYSQECLDFGMAFTGDKEMMSEVRKDDIVVLRKNLKEIVAVGKVVEYQGISVGFADENDADGSKDWLRDFDGWNLRAYCYVEWHKPSDPVRVPGQLAQRAICRINKAEIRECADQEFKESDPYPPSKRRGPSPTQRITDEEIKDFLGQKALSPEDVTAALSTVNEIRSLANHYYDFGYGYWDEVKEHEIRTFLIVPLLLALGWNERQIKIELSTGKLGIDKRGSIDVACFSAEYKPDDKKANRENCKLIIESKRFSSGISKEAPEQAKRYAEGLPPNCKVVFASNGYCYKAFTRDGAGEFSKEPSAYLNLREPKRKYPIDPSVDGALEVLELLLPR